MGGSIGRKGYKYLFAIFFIEEEAKK